VIVVDTSVLAEMVRPRPNEAVIRWAAEAAGSDVSTTAIAVAELLQALIRSGGEGGPATEAAGAVLGRFGDRILAFDDAAAFEYGRMAAVPDRSLRPLPMADAQVAAICRVHRAGLATRDVRQFEGLGIDLVDPWRYL
jgi:predicted nucleic acid-binding protein